MKKKLLVTLLLSIVMLSGCGNSGEEPKSGESTQDVEETQDAEKEDDELSQSEWMEQNADEMDNGYEVVDEINVDTDDISVKYTGFEIRDDIDDNNQPVKRIMVYFDYTNKMSEPMSSSNAINCIAYQGGIELQGWGGVDYLNDMTDIKDGATLNVGFMFDIINAEEPVEINISEGLWFKGTELFAQQQEIQIAE